MIKRFMKFAWNVFSNEKGFLQALIPLAGAAASAYAASRQPSTMSQTTQYIPPVLNPQQAGMQNMLYYGALSNLYGQQDPGYQNLLSQYIYGGVPGMQATQPTTGTTAEQIISGYQQQTAQAEQAEEQLGELESDIVYKTLKPVIEKASELNKMSLAERASGTSHKEEMLKLAKEASGQLQDLAGMGKIDADSLVYKTSGFGIMEYVLEKVRAGEKLPPGKSIFHNSNITPEDLGYDSSAARWDSREETQKFNQFAEYQPKYNIEAMYKQYSEAPAAETPKIPIPETPVTTEGIPATAPGGISAITPGGAPEGGILGQIADPSWIGEQFGLAKEAGMEEIGDWYSQAARELEQRGISQHGGLMGSQYERDVGGMLGRRGEMETQLGSGLRQAQIGMERQNWFDVLNALTGLQGMQSNLQTARTAPWIGAAQNIANAPYGTSTTTPFQGVGMFPAAIGGAYAGAGLAQSLSNWGQRSQPATAAGAGISGSSGLNLTGTQNLWNQYSGSNLWS